MGVITGTDLTILASEFRDRIAATGGPGSHRSVVEIKQVFTVGKFRVGHDVSINSYKLQATSCNAGGCGGKYIAPWPRYLP
jgi:hypothetical protein